MISEDFEFLISQFADGTLAGDDAEAVRARIDADPQAVALLREFRDLDQMLVASAVVPSIDYDLLRTRISGSIPDSKEADRPVVAGRIGFGFSARTKWMSVAASAMIAVGIGSLLLHHSSPVTPTANPTKSNPVVAQQTPGEMVVVGPTVEAPAGPATEEIKVGPSPALVARGSGWMYANEVMTRPSSVKIADTGTPHPRPH